MLSWLMVKKHRPGRQAVSFFAMNLFGHGALLTSALCQVPASRFPRLVGAPHCAPETLNDQEI
jgi:hypothetical protein